MEVFDLTHTPGLIQPAYLFDAAFVFAGLVLIVIVLAARDMKTAGKLTGTSRFSLVQGRNPLLAAIIGIPACFLIAGGQAYGAFSLRQAVTSGQYVTLEGCLDYFQPGEAVCRKNGAGAELWGLGGQAFSYCGDTVTVTYHAIEGSEGIVHPTSRVRVSYVPGLFGGKDIVRLETRPNLCPAAPPPPEGP